MFTALLLNRASATCATWLTWFSTLRSSWPTSMSDLEKAKYHKRSINGIKEKEDSYARISAIDKFNKEIEQIEKETGYVKEMDQIVDSVSKSIIKVMNDLPDYKKVSEDLKPSEKIASHHLILDNHKLGFDRFGQSLSDNETNETFIQTLRKKEEINNKYYLMLVD